MFTLVLLLLVVLLLLWWWMWALQKAHDENELLTKQKEKVRSFKRCVCVFVLLCYCVVGPFTCRLLSLSLFLPNTLHTNHIVALEEAGLTSIEKAAPKCVCSQTRNQPQKTQKVNRIVGHCTRSYMTLYKILFLNRTKASTDPQTPTPTHTHTRTRTHTHSLISQHNFFCSVLSSSNEFSEVSELIDHATLSVTNKDLLESERENQAQMDRYKEDDIVFKGTHRIKVLNSNNKVRGVVCVVWMKMKMKMTAVCGSPFIPWFGFVILW